MFPTSLVEIDSIEETTSFGKSFLFDFDTGDFILKDGKIVKIDEIDALKVWITKILKTEKFKFQVYEDKNEYGTTLLELVNSGFPINFVYSEIEREVTEALLKNPAILNVNTFNFQKIKRDLNISFSVESIYNTIVQEVVFNVR